MTAADVPVRSALIDAHERGWAAVAAPGTWLTEETKRSSDVGGRGVAALSTSSSMQCDSTRNGAYANAT